MPASTAHSTQIRGRYGVYLVPNVEAVDARCRLLVGLLATASPVTQALIHDDLDMLLERRSLLASETR